MSGSLEVVRCGAMDAGQLLGFGFAGNLDGLASRARTIGQNQLLGFADGEEVGVLHVWLRAFRLAWNQNKALPYIIAIGIALFF